MTLKTPDEVEVMRKGGQLAAKILNQVLAEARAGTSTLELDELAERLILASGGQPSFKGFEGYPYSICVNLNEGVVHGLPARGQIIKKGDVVSVDLGVSYQGFHTDAAATIEVGSLRHRKFLLAGRRALKEAVAQCHAGNTIGDIGSAIQSVIEARGFSVIKELVGHGVGRRLHEPPSIPGYGQRSSGSRLKKGMTLAIEVIYSQKPGEVIKSPDGWTIETNHDNMAALFEDTVAISPSGPIVLTKKGGWL